MGMDVAPPGEGEGPFRRNGVGLVAHNQGFSYIRGQNGPRVGQGAIFR
jgi:hypothetical protein